MTKEEPLRALKNIEFDLINAEYGFRYENPNAMHILQEALKQLRDVIEKEERLNLG